MRSCDVALSQDHKVDLSLHAHHHPHQRTCPVAAGEGISNYAQGVAEAPGPPGKHAHPCVQGRDVGLMDSIRLGCPSDQALVV
jgi:hypothetical protein